MSSVPDFKLSEVASMSCEEIERLLKTSVDTGITEQAAFSRLRESGLNVIDSKKHITELGELLSHFKNPLVLILLAAASISAGMGETANALIIFFIILLSISLDYLQERGARNAAAILKKTLISRVMVTRGGISYNIDTAQLCAGDLVSLRAGNIIPADVRLITARDLFVNQSSLTGESFPVEKHAVVTAGAADDTSLENMCYMGSGVISGTGRAIVVRTGRSTMMGKIADELNSRQEQTDFGRGMQQFGLLITRVTLALVVFIFVVNAISHHAVFESFLFAIAIAVGLTPELLPMVMSVAMSRGAMKMARKGAIVKKIAAIPNFGSMDVLCTDKTGTLTTGEMQLVKCVDIEGAPSANVFRLAYLNSLLQTGAANPLDQAVLDSQRPQLPAFEKTDEIPFDFDRKRLSVVVKQEGGFTLICKGAPEAILKVCRTDAAVSQRIQQLYEGFSQDGLRVLAIASKQLPGGQGLQASDENELSFEGLAVFLDPPREDAAATIAEMEKIGVEVKIITGDHHLVTEKICREIGLPIKGILQGFEAEQLSDAALQEKVRSISIFTRFSPDQKNRVIHALKAHHTAVGYLGDGINDAPSLKAADIGISVANASDVAKDAADIILTHKQLIILRDGIMAGRETFANTMKYILMGLSSNFGNMFSVAAAAVFLPFLPMLPVQILLNNFLYDTAQITIPADNNDADSLYHPQRWNMTIIRNFMLIFGLLSSVFDLVIFFLLYHAFPVREAQFRTGWFMESLATQILVVFIIRTRKLSFIQSRPAMPLVISTLVCLATGWLLPYLPFAAVIGFEPLPLHIMLYICAVVIVYLFCAEVTKRLLYGHHAKKPNKRLPAVITAPPIQLS
ncbi:magnesium-translocating P-type ATPase [Chitinophaga vietnamensis]|uniref:magnesium-translocating P-type ATPase n=1 Tax=Chitinophaga vietnamensis TaxID=2593957 RepID=UPI001177B99F|nr:magnesium-translocating P-type ATPase [Chitinophaga vietnamensis]